MRRQDEAGLSGAPLGVFVNEVLLALVDRKTDPYGEHARLAYGGAEILLVCPRHPAASAVDCLDCEPA